MYIVKLTIPIIRHIGSFWQFSNINNVTMNIVELNVFSYFELFSLVKISKVKRSAQSMLHI